MNKTPIEWTDFTSNPIYAIRKDTGKRGHFCTHVSPGCTNCYSEQWNGWRGNGLQFKKQNESNVEFVLNEKELAQFAKVPAGKKVFVCDMTDLFHEAIPDEMIWRTFQAMAHAPQAIFQVLTKRAKRMMGLVPKIRGTLPDRLNHVWLGVSAEDQQRADERIPLLFQTPAAVRFVSYEPALAAVDFRRFLPDEIWHECESHFPEFIENHPGIDWLIIGGESGHNARPCNIEWIRSAVRQCKEAGVACFVKQLGAKPFEPYSDGTPLDDIRLKSCKGGDPAEWEESLRVREFPK